MLNPQMLKVDGGRARIFRPAFGQGSNYLSWDRSSFFDEDSTVAVGEPVERIYDDRTQLAVPLVFTHDDEEGTAFILFDELSEKSKEAIRGMFPECPLLLRSVH